MTTRRPPPPPPSPPSYLLEGRYLAEKRVGRGDTTDVFSGSDTWSGEIVAIRMLRIDRADQEDAFQRRAERLFGVSSARVLRAIHIGEDRDGRPFLVTELLVGRNLDKLERVRWEVGCEIIRQSAAAIAEMHLNGLNHGSLRASTLFVAASSAGGSRVKLLNLGTGDRWATAASDVAALLAIFHRLLTGVLPPPPEERSSTFAVKAPDTPAEVEDYLTSWLLATGDAAPTASEIATTLKLLVDSASESPPRLSYPTAPRGIVLPKSAPEITGRRGEGDD